MQVTEEKIIYTIGHSTQTLENFTKILDSFGVKMLCDIRRFPGSRKFPHFNQDNLEIKLPQSGISYMHLESLGGRRKAQANSDNDVWRNPSFQGYADYMDSDAFHEGIHQLETIAGEQVTAYMCSEGVWWRCHRALVSDFLKAKGWNVEHIMPAGKLQEHPYTSAASIANGKVYYSKKAK